MRGFELVSDRLVLRPLGMSDASRIKALVSKDVAKYFGAIPWPYSLRLAKEWIKTIPASKKLVNLAIVRKEDNVVIGNVEVNFSNNSKAVGCLSYWLGKDYWDEGYATEAVKLILRYSFSSLKMKRVYASVNEGNNVSQKLLTKLGFKLEGRLRNHILNRFTKKYEDKMFYGIMKMEFK